MQKHKIKTWIQQVVSYCQNSIQVPSCIVCKLQIRDRSPLTQEICRECATRIPWIVEYVCFYCGRTIQCEDCQKRINREQTSLLFNRSVVQYNNQMKRWLAQYKYRGDERWEQLLATMMWIIWQREFVGQADIISFVPLSTQRLAERTFNQAQRLAERIAQSAQLPVCNLLTRDKHTDKQSQMNRSSRMQNVKTLFTIHEQAERILIDLEQRLQRRPKIVFIDDVYTTGSTLHQCAQVLTVVYPVDIYSFTWARS